MTSERRCFGCGRALLEGALHASCRLGESTFDFCRACTREGVAEELLRDLATYHGRRDARRRAHEERERNPAVVGFFGAIGSGCAWLAVLGGLGIPTLGGTLALFLLWPQIPERAAAGVAVLVAWALVILAGILLRRRPRKKGGAS